MTDIVQIPHLDFSEGDPSDKDSPGWTYAEDHELVVKHVIIRCTCGHWVTPGNQILLDGTLKGSFLHEYKDHPGEGCGWHTYLRLMNYP